MREWNFQNIDVSVLEKEYDYDLHCFEVRYDGKFIGMIYPNSINDMNECIRQLDMGNDPITCGWEDGLGNPCTLSGWGRDIEDIVR